MRFSMCGAWFLSLAGLANAQGTITFRGEVVMPTCDVETVETLRSSDCATDKRQTSSFNLQVFDQQGRQVTDESLSWKLRSVAQVTPRHRVQTYVFNYN